MSYLFAKYVKNSLIIMSIAIAFLGLANMLNDWAYRDIKKRLHHLETITFDSARCPMNKELK